jgi:hypothetical protein
MPNEQAATSGFSAVFESANARYRQAAWAYFVYGLVYMTGAAQLGLTGASSRAMESSGFFWYLLGALVMLGFPLLINKGFKWFTRALVLLLGVRIYGLILVMLGPTASEMVPLVGCWEMSKSVGALIFAVVATATMLMLSRAAFMPPGGEEGSDGGSTDMGMEIEAS